MKEYIIPVELKKINLQKAFSENQWGSCLHFEIAEEQLKDIDLAIFEVNEDRASLYNRGCKAGGKEIRKSLYSLFKGDYKMKIADLGTISAGNSVSDTYFAVQELIDLLLKNKVIPILLGGSKDLVYAVYQAYTRQEQLVNFVSIDSKFSLGDADQQINDENYLSKILFHHPSALFNFSNIGYQTYFVDLKELSLLDELFFDIYRLGTIRSDIKLAEPIIRNADFVSLSLNSVSKAHAPANATASPNGFTAEQACQMTRYAGMSDKLTSFGIYDYNPEIEDGGNTSMLIAQMIWYFVDGFYYRKGDFPIADKSNYTKYSISLEQQELIFYKSAKTDRWWMEVPYLSSAYKKYKNHLMLPCNYEEYLTASNNELPERWFQTFKKLK